MTTLTRVAAAILAAAIATATLGVLGAGVAFASPITNALESDGNGIVAQTVQ